jgi:DNA topoisomerase-1
MTYILVIVESKGKIKKIQTILGDKYKVIASYGHILDLDPTKAKPLSIDIENNYKPFYSIIENKDTTVLSIKNDYIQSTDVLLASDKDREGEMISWSLAHVLDIKNPKRITFISITKKDILDSVASPRDIDMHLVDAQQTRRILDRIIGYKLSPLLCKQYSNRLSAGRVQSVVVRLIYEKENEIRNKLQTIKSFFQYSGCFHDSQRELHAKLVDKSTKERIKYTKDEKDSLFHELIDASYIYGDVIKSLHIKNPSSPFTTSTLLQEVKTHYGIGAKQTMNIAQHLYEKGYITYMRTDSMALSEEALTHIKKYVHNHYGESFYRYKVYDTKSAHTQEAHEAIRPCNVELENIDDQLENKIYHLIWKRTIASQMQPAKYRQNTIIIEIKEIKDKIFIAENKELEWPGFLILDKQQKIEEVEINIQKGSSTLCNEIECIEVYERVPTRYDESSLIHQLDPSNLNIGRPSTYASIVNKIIEMQYVEIKDVNGTIKTVDKHIWKREHGIQNEKHEIELGKDVQKYVPTEIGIVVTEYLIKHFENIMNYQFTANLEEQLDKIALGQLDKFKVIDIFYKQLIGMLSEIAIEPKNNIIGYYENNEVTLIYVKKKPILLINLDGKKKYIDIHPYNVQTLTDDAIQEQIKNALQFPKSLGQYKDHEIIIKKGMYGYYIQYNNKNFSITNENMNKEEAEKIIDKRTPTNIGQYLDQDIMLYYGRYGHYIQYKEQKIPVKDIENLTHENAIEIIKQQRVYIDGDIEYKIMNGKYGPYICVKSSESISNVKLPTDIDRVSLTIDEIKKIVHDYNTTPKRKYYKPKAAAKPRAKAAAKPRAKAAAKPRAKAAAKPRAKAAAKPRAKAAAKPRAKAAAKPRAKAAIAT